MERNYSGIVFAFLGGAVAGATVAYLTAPASGPETRARLRRFASEQRDRVASIPDAFRDAKDAFTETLATADPRH